MNRIMRLAIVMALVLNGCKTTNFLGTSDQSPATKSPNPPQNPIDQPPPPGAFGFGKIQDRSVNTGDRSFNYSEDLAITLTPQGGTPPYVYDTKITPANEHIKINGNNLQWRPGFIDNGTYRSEEGTYSVSIGATDSQRLKTSTSFNINVVLLSWKSQVVLTSDLDQMNVEFTINELLHPNRIYAHNGTVGGQSLNSRTCRNMANPNQTIQLDNTPSITNSGKSAASNNGTDHKMNLSMKFPVSSQPVNDMMFVTRLNFMAQDDGKNVQTGETGIFIIYSYARCRNSNLSDQDCKKSILTNGGKSSMFYCSDYIGSNTLEQTLQSSYCGTAKLNGVAVPGC